MVKFRRSMKNEKAESKPHHISIPPKDAIAITPPKKVIKALHDWTPHEDSNPSSEFLGFSAGDFLHVVGRENETDWYEACNPLQGTRGLVPVAFFEPVGKTARDSGSSIRSAHSQPLATHDSGYAEQASTNGSNSTPDFDPKQMRLSKSMAKGNGAMVFGVVMYDFKAERPDELEAKEGEAIIIIAQSNPEWFVAKPITRLGGPGLIPVSFIEIRDMGSGKAVTNAQEAVQRAGVPKVEEWKKMAADYKNGSIPLGKLEANSAQTLQQGVERMSITRGQLQNGYKPSSAQTQSPYRSGSAQSQSQAYRPPPSKVIAPLKASVQRYVFENDLFYFIVECQMEDGRHWELSRVYQDFYDLQIALIQEYPAEAGNVSGIERSLPYMPGPVTYVTDYISNRRRANLDDYLKNLLKLGAKITRSDLVCQFFAPRARDYEIDPDAATDEYRLSGGSQHSGTDPSHRISHQSSVERLNAPQNPYTMNSTFVGHAHQQRSQGSINQQYRQQSELSAHPPMLRQNSALTQASASSGGSMAAHKIKVWFEEDNCVVIRMPLNFRFVDLCKKLRERRALERGGDGSSEDEDLVVEYRDEVEGQYYPIDNDDDLHVALDRNPKLTLSVTERR